MEGDINMCDLLLDSLLEFELELDDETPEQKRDKRRKARRHRCGAEMDKPEGGQFIYQCELIAECLFCAGRLGETWLKRMLQAIEQGDVWCITLSESEAHKFTSRHDKVDYLRIPQANGLYVIYHTLPAIGGALQSEYDLSSVDWTNLATSKAQSGKRVSGHLGKLAQPTDERVSFKSVAVGVHKEHVTPATRLAAQTLKETYEREFRYVESIQNAEALAESFKVDYTLQMLAAGVPQAAIIVIRVTSRITLFVSQKDTNGVSYANHPSQSTPVHAISAPMPL